MMLESMLFKELFKDLYKLVRGKASLAKKIHGINVGNAYLSASNISRVKTIWQVDKHVDLHAFYYPTKIIVDDDNNVLVSGLSVFPENSKLVIEGIAGQGKSILLRYLTSKALKDGATLPLFIELRKISSKKSIEELLIDSLKELGLEVNSSELELLLSTGKCTLILDAFDEVSTSNVKDLITTIEGYCNSFHNLPIIISSRPNSEIQKSNYFTVYSILKLTPSDFEPILKKLFSLGDNRVDELLNAIHNNEGRVSEVITTPLLLTLLVISYQSVNEVPSNLSEFYGKLFNIMSFRHDATKPGFKREFTSGLSAYELPKIFDAFCFFCMKENLSSINRDKALSISLKAGELVGVEGINPELFLEDISNVTCLILEEGFEYHFIHKSIREYHAAHFIKEHATERLRMRFYNKATKFYASYDQELKFLSVIDEIAYLKHFYIPYLDNIPNELCYGEANLSIDSIFSAGSVGQIQFVAGEFDRLINHGVFYDKYMGVTRSILDFFYDHLIEKSSDMDESIFSNPSFEVHDGSKDPKTGVIPFNDLLLILEKEEEFIIEISRILNRVKEESLRINRLVKKHEDNFDAIDF